MKKEELFQQFEQIFGHGEDATLFFAPGRVNLIGEHTDYNGGHVFPCALTIGTYCIARKRNDTSLRFYSVNFPDSGVISSDIHNLENKEEDGWTNYPKGVITHLIKEGHAVDFGMDMLFFGTIPNSSGLSSSASIEVVTGTVSKKLFDLEFDGIYLSLLCQKSENQFNGVNCGIMDQFAIAMGKKDHAIFLDTATLEYEYAKISLVDECILILNTNKKRGLGDSKYNERRGECEEALALLNITCDFPSLGALSKDEWEANQHLIADDILKKRAKHAVYENLRTIEAVEALKNNQLNRFYQLMNASHDSLQYDYEVTGKELDTIVAIARKQDGVLAARMTGAGFGGCAVSIVKKDKVESIIENISVCYKKQIGYEADFYVVEIGGGPY